MTIRGLTIDMSLTLVFFGGLSETDQILMSVLFVSPLFGLRPLFLFGLKEKLRRQARLNTVSICNKKCPDLTSEILSFIPFPRHYNEIFSVCDSNGGKRLLAHVSNPLLMHLQFHQVYICWRVLPLSPSAHNHNADRP